MFCCICPLNVGHPRLLISEWSTQDGAMGLKGIMPAVLQGFGFCEFEEADSVVRALQHLAGLDVDGQALLVKCNGATQTYVDEWKARKVTGVLPSHTACTI